MSGAAAGEVSRVAAAMPRDHEPGGENDEEEGSKFKVQSSNFKVQGKFQDSRGTNRFDR
jgi:hypothetical protein